MSSRAAAREAGSPARSERHTNFTADPQLLGRLVDPGFRTEDDFSLFLLEDLDRVPLFIWWLLLVVERTLEIHLGQEVIRIKFEEAGE